MKKKSDFKKFALAGLSTGLLIAAQIQAAEDKNKSTETTSTKSNENDGNMGYYLMSEDELQLELTPAGIAMFKNLSPEGKALALKVASMRCDHTNECSGLNACSTDKNECAGKGSCKGTGKCAISDKNLAVKLVKEKMDKMAQKRAQVSKPSSH